MRASEAKTGSVRAYSVDATDGTLVSLEVALEEARDLEGYTLPIAAVVRTGGDLIVVRAPRAAGEADV
jgi:hypothetical protein